MRSEASLKVPDGKLLKLEIETEDKNVVEASLRGDFFIEPPSALHELESVLEAQSEGTEKDKLEEEIDEVGAELIGFSASDLSEVFMTALGDKNE